MDNSPFKHNNIHIISDFDGTITDRDTLETLLNRFGTPEWLEIEHRLENDLVTVDDAFQQQMALLNVSLDEALCQVENSIITDDTVGECAENVQAAGGRFTIVSAGFHEIIAHMLDGKIPQDVAIYANRIEVNDNHWTVIPSPTPKIRGLCTHCKRYWVEKARDAGDYVVYVGDGYTDRCPAEAAHRVYARGTLLDYRTREGLPTHPLQNFGALWQDLEQLIQKQD